MDIQKMTERFDLAAEKYDEQRRFFIPCFDDFYETSISFLSDCRNDFKSILDLGAGTGLLTKYLFQKFPSASFTLVDVSPQMLEIAKSRFKNQNNIEYIISDYSKSLPEKKFDLISSALSIHHLENDSNIINENYNKWWNTFIENSQITKEDLHLAMKRRELDRENTVDETKLILKKIGFQNVECIYCSMKFGVILAAK